jgi:hypothetical protein
MMSPTNEQLQSARRERARRWAGTDLRGYPAVPPEEETPETLAAAPVERAERKPKTPAGEP